jgi:D-alanyl-D-alanine carboxypeptidase
MLPSGNDSAIILAEHFGEYLYDEKYFKCQEYANISNNNQYVGSWQFPDGYIKYFLKEMNANAFKLRMFQTNFDSPHGMANKYNYSTAFDLCLLTNKCMQIPFFRKVVGTQIY